MSSQGGELEVFLWSLGWLHLNEFREYLMNAQNLGVNLGGDL